ncbi:hypothetical protein PV08_06255 [Exophiala spinifera]|uniref:Uncharacterized protein n=1 Tax=Exophiala spinifera TaxID=91928 RepID=A0A0D2BY20_9EURO|nr:uncharacterized protein PV08_06255 [Exophiala spinifera]KIW16204.1 hypothetical protein PV08_06255 [Exophiala spinifera]
MDNKTEQSLSPSTTSAPLIPDRITPGLYLSDIHTACAVLSPYYPAPNRPDIKYILSIMDKPERTPSVHPEDESKFVLKFLKLRDVSTDDLLEILGEACEFIKSSMSNDDGGVLVHCAKGISRSASVILAFVMEDMCLDYDTALRYVRQFRPRVKPNLGFEAQLKLWHRMEYSIFEADGTTHKEEYSVWKANNEHATKALAFRILEKAGESNKKDGTT